MRTILLKTHHYSVKNTKNIDLSKIACLKFHITDKNIKKVKYSYLHKINNQLGNLNLNIINQMLIK